MNKHTLGPWYPDSKGYVWRRPVQDLYEYGGGVAGEKPIASVVKGWYGEGEQGYPVEANARLIAAAPDLFEALELAVRQNSHDMMMTGDELRTCEAALAKAKGEQNETL